ARREGECDPPRHILAIHLTAAGDLVLCPTHLGRVVAVEAKTGKVRWTHEDPPLDATTFATFAPAPRSTQSGPRRPPGSGSSSRRSSPATATSTPPPTSRSCSA